MDLMHVSDYTSDIMIYAVAKDGREDVQDRICTVFGSASGYSLKGTHITTDMNLLSILELSSVPLTSARHFVDDAVEIA